MRQTIIKVSGLTTGENNKLIMLVKEYGVQCGASVTWSYDEEDSTAHCAVHKTQKKE